MNPGTGRHVATVRKQMGKKSDIISGLGLAAFCALIYHQTLGLSGEPVAGGLSPASFPRALAIGIGGLGLLLAGRALLSRPAVEDAEPMFGPYFLQMLAFFAALTGYILLMPFLGYLVPTAIFLTVSVVIISGTRSAGTIAAGLVFSLVAAVGVYYVFAVFLGVPLIEGPVDEFLRYTILAGGG